MNPTYCKYSGHEVGFLFQVKSYSDQWGDHPHREGWTSGKGKGLPQQQQTESSTGRGWGGALCANAAKLLPKVLENNLHSQ